MFNSRHWIFLNGSGKSGISPYFELPCVIIAGIYEKWICPPKSGEFNFDDDPENPSIETFSIITTAAIEMVSAVHERMPVIVAENHYLWWLDARKFEADFLKFIFRPYPAEEMNCYRVSKWVNNTKNDLSECILPG